MNCSDVPPPHEFDPQEADSEFRRIIKTPREPIRFHEQPFAMTGLSGSGEVGMCAAIPQADGDPGDEDGR